MRGAIVALLALVACGEGAGGTFECGGKALDTVPASAVCDGVVDCWGGQDERADDCATELAFCGQIEAQAILADEVCDGTEDCSDGVDELDCE